MAGAPQDRNIQAARSLTAVVVLTVGSLYALGGDVHPPHGNPLVYALAVSWLSAFPIGMMSGVVIASLSPRAFSLARWEQEGEIYDRVGVQAFRRVLLNSPLGWINPNIHLSAGRSDSDRLLRELNGAEGVHWVLAAVSAALATWYFVDDRAAYGYSMLLVNIPFNVYPIILQRRNRGRVLRLLR